MDSTLILTWIQEDNSAEYFINGNSVGKDETGFRIVLEHIAQSVNIRTVLLKYPTRNYIDGRDTLDYFPFSASYPDLVRITGEKKIRIEFMPEF
jgi:hypothetical protein